MNRALVTVPDERVYVEELSVCEHDIAQLQVDVEADSKVKLIVAYYNALVAEKVSSATALAIIDREVEGGIHPDSPLLTQMKAYYSDPNHAA